MSSVIDSIKKAGQLSLIAAFLSACSTMSNVQVTLPTSVEPSHVINGVPVIEQKTKQCGAASLAMMLNQRGNEITADELNPLVFTPGKGGTLPIDLISQSRIQGYIPYKIDGNLNSLITEIDAGNPVLVMENLGLSWLPQWHFSVVVGYDLSNNNLILHSGKSEQRTVAFTTFTNTWDKAENWGIVIVPQGVIPATANAASYLEAIAAVQNLHPMTAVKSYLAVINRWPDDQHADSLARLGIFEHYYVQGNYRAAKDVLANTANPLTAAQWNNLAFSLAQMNCMPEAKQAIACAIRLEPESQYFKNSSQEINSWETLNGEHSDLSSKGMCSIRACED